MVLLDHYDRRARLAPALLAAAPISVVLLAAGVRQAPVVAGIIGLLSIVGLPILLVGLVRDRGLALQERLWAEWGGPPTTQLLVSGDGRAERWRDEATRVTGINLTATFPPAPGEAEAAVARLRERTRDRDSYPLVFEENCNYGFQRNLLAMRPVGRGVCALSALALGVLVVLRLAADVSIEWFDLGAGFAGLVLLAGVWHWAPNPNRVRGAAGRYAERLLDAAPGLPKWDAQATS